MLVTGLVFSYMNGIIHPYYMVALAPGIAALIGIGAMSLWQAPLGAGKLAGRIAAACGVLASAVWALHPARPDAGLAAVAALGGAGRGRGRRGPGPGRPGAGPAGSGGSRRARLALAAAPLGLALVAGLAGPAAYALDTVATAHTGAIPSAGPAVGRLRRRSRRRSRRLPRCRAVRPRPGRNRDSWRNRGAERDRSARRKLGPERKRTTERKRGPERDLGAWRERAARRGPARPGRQGAWVLAAAPGTVASAQAAGWAATPR